MKFKHITGRIVEPKNAYEESILKSNSNYTAINEDNEENIVKIEKKSQKTTKKVADEPS